MVLLNREFERRMGWRSVSPPAKIAALHGSFSYSERSLLSTAKGLHRNWVEWYTCIGKGYSQMQQYKSQAEPNIALRLIKYTQTPVISQE
jgi:hypothetical protein